MPNDATVKDVLYALEFLGEQLCRWPAHKAGTPNAWSLEPSGRKVKPRVADEARAKGAIIPVAAAKYGEDRYGWASAA